MKITEQYLKNINACKEGIKWAINNKLIGMPVKLVKGIKGDYERYIRWLKNEINIIREFDENNNVIHYKDRGGVEYWRKYDKNNNLIHYKNSNGFEEWQQFDSHNNLIHYKDSKGLEETHIVKYYPDGQLKQYDDLVIPYFDKE